MTRPLLYLRNDPHDRWEVPRASLEAAGVPWVEVDAEAEAVEGWPEVSGFGGLMVGGGAMNADQVDRYPFLSRERAMLREAVHAGMPVFGLCLGAQLLARALDAPVVRAPSREVGFVPIELTEEGRADPVLSAFSTGDRVFQFHEDTFAVPEGAVLLARGGAVEAQAYRVGDRAWGVQFHPEVGHGEVEAWIAEVGDRLEEDWGKPPEEVRAEAARHLPAQQARARAMFDRFATLLT